MVIRASHMRSNRIHRSVRLIGAAVPTVALAVLIGCVADAPAASPALVLLREQLRTQIGLAVSRIEQPDDSTLAVHLEEVDGRAIGDRAREQFARRTAARVVRFWPDPALRRVNVVLERQARLGPLVVQRGETRYTFDASAVALPPALPGATPIELPVGLQPTAPARP